jgi:hypothetical protein
MKSSAHLILLTCPLRGGLNLRANFLNRDYIYISGLRIEHCEQVGYVPIITSDCSVPGKTARVEHQTAVANPSGLALNPLNTLTIINHKIAFVTITKRKKDQITSSNKSGQYLGFCEVSFLSGLHKPHLLPLMFSAHGEANMKAAMMRLNYQTLRENLLA